MQDISRYPAFYFLFRSHFLRIFLIFRPYSLYRKTLSILNLHVSYYPFQIFEAHFFMFRHKSSPGLGAFHGLSPRMNRINRTRLARFAKLAQKGFTEFGRLCYDTAHSREAPQEGAAFSLLMT